MTSPKFAHIQDIDIFALETIYADGRTMGRLLQDAKDKELRLETENNQLRAENITLRYRNRELTKALEEATTGRDAA